jgi:hypothetical protein
MFGRLSQSPKCKFFAWLILHNKPLTTDNVLKKNWDCNPICPLCYCISESADHLLTKCNYSEAMWRSISQLFNLPPYDVIAAPGGPVDWVFNLSRSGRRQEEEKIGFSSFSGGLYGRREIGEFFIIRRDLSLGLLLCFMTLFPAFIRPLSWHMSDGVFLLSGSFQSAVLIFGLSA